MNFNLAFTDQLAPGDGVLKIEYLSGFTPEELIHVDVAGGNNPVFTYDEYW